MKEESKKILKYFLYGVIALVAVILAFNSYTVVQAGTVKTQTFLGKVTEKPLEPGFHVVNPFASFDTYSTKDIALKFDKLQVPSQDKFKSSVDMTVMLTFDGNKAPMNRIRAGTQDQALEKYVTEKLLSILREFGKSVPKAQDLFNAEIQAKLQTEVQQEIEAYARPYGYTVSQIFLQDITLPEVIMTQVTNTKIREESVNQAKAELARVQQETQQAVAKAEADRQSRENQARANERDADADFYIAKKAAEAKLYGAQKESEANNVLQKTITPEMTRWKELDVEMIRANKYKGDVPTTVVGGDMGSKMIMDLRQK